MRPLSVVSDLKEEIHRIFDEAIAAGLEADQIESIVRSDAAALVRDMEDARRRHEENLHSRASMNAQKGE